MAQSDGRLRCAFTPVIISLEKRVGELPGHVHTYDRSLRAIRTDQYKYIRGSDDSSELYDIQTDPDETTDLSDTHPDLVDTLDTRLDEWLDSFEQADPQRRNHDVRRR